MRTSGITNTTHITRCALSAVAASALLLAATPTASATRAIPSPRAAPSTTTTTHWVRASAYAVTAADARMGSALTARATTARFGTAFSGAVVDAASNVTVWRRNSTTGLMPASTNKLVTASNALTLFGPNKRWTTRVRTGVAGNEVILEGSGDPSLSSANLDALAASTATWLLARGSTTARVFVDDDVFPTPSLAYGWKSSYVPGSITAVRGVVRDQIDAVDTSAEAALYLRDRLKAHGVPASYIGRADAASTSTVVAGVQGATLSSMVVRMLMNSDNEIAEALHKQVGIGLGHGATWTGAQTAQAKELAAQKLTSGTLYDGSGLSRADRISALQLAQIVDRGIDPGTQATLSPLKSGLPTAGRTGTLASRFTTAASKCAVGRVRAKTGTLSDVVSLAGWTTGADGRVKAFAFVVNGKTSSTTLKQDVDMLAATVTGCY